MTAAWRDEGWEGRGGGKRSSGTGSGSRKTARSACPKAGSLPVAPDPRFLPWRGLAACASLWREVGGVGR